jgi:dTDP-glucose 4,6-dehydratase
MKNILVTGGAGFIGSNFVHHLLGKYADYRVVVLDKLTYAGRLENLKPADGNPRFTFVRGDICDVEAVRGAIEQFKIDTIVNFAAESHVDRSIMESDAVVKTNVNGTHVLLEAARELKLERFHQISSVSGDTPLLVRHKPTGAISLRPIAELENEILTDFDVLTMTDDYQVEFRPMKYFVKHPADEFYEIVYNGGGRIRATGSHSVFVFTNTGIVTKPTSALKVGDLLVTFTGDAIERRSHTFDLRQLLAAYSYDGIEVALSKRQTVMDTVAVHGPAAYSGLQKALAGEISAATSYRLLEALATEGLLQKTDAGAYNVATSNVSGSFSQVGEQKWRLIKNKLHVPFDHLETTPLLMKVFGLYLAEGHCSHTANELKRNLRTVTFTIGLGETHYLDLLRQCASDAFHIRALVKRRESTYQITYASYWVHALFSEFGATVETKRIPPWLWTLPKAQVEAFFSGYEGDATIKSDGRRYYTTVNRSLADSLVWLARLNNINCLVSTRIVQQVAGKTPPGITKTRRRKFYDLQFTAENNRPNESQSWRTPMSRCLPAVWLENQIGPELFKRTSPHRKQLVGKDKVERMLNAVTSPPADIVAVVSSPIGVAKVKSVQLIRDAVMVYDVSVPGNERFFGGNVPCLLHNTDEVYGAIPAPGRSKEGDPLEPRSPYSASKAGAEHLVYAYFVTYGLPVTTTRGSNNIGPYHYPEKAVPLFTTNAIDNQSLPVYGDGKQQRDYQYVLDHCEAIDVVLHKGKLGEVYNVGTGVETYNIDMARKILDLLGKPHSLITHVVDRAGHDRRYALDISRLHALGWTPSHTFDQALEKTVRWFVENEWWWRPIKTGEYLEYYKKQYVER